MMGEHEIITGQSVKEKKFLESIKKKNKERQKLPRGKYIEKSK